VIILMIIGACTPKESPEEKAAKEAEIARLIDEAVPEETTPSDFGVAEQPIATASPTSTPAPRRTISVYPSSMDERLHPCEKRWATIPAPGYYVCDYGPDGLLRWVDDEKTRAAAAQAEIDAYWAEHAPAQPQYVPPADSSIDNYTGPRCYNPGGQTYRRC
jgi:hypothetical protein